MMLLYLSEANSANKDKKPLKLIVQTDDQKDKVIKSTIEELNNIAKNMEKTAILYRTINQALYWEEEAKKSFIKFVESKGYYNTYIETEYIEEKNTIIFNIYNWERYKIKKIEINYAQDANQNIIVPDVNKLKIKIGDFAVAKNILESQNQLKEYIEQENCLLKLEINNAAIVDNLDNSMSLAYVIHSGPSAQIKSIDVSGLKTLNADYVKKLINLKEGQCFKNSLIENSKSELQGSGFFVLTDPIVPNKTDENGKIPVIFKLQERKHRSLKAGLSFASDLGAGATLGWDHRNLFGSGENLESKLFVNKQDQIIDLNFVKPFFQRDDQNLKLDASAKKLVSKAFNSKEVELSAGIDRKINDIWLYGAGLKYSYSNITKAANPGNYSFISVPLFLKRNSKNDIFDATKGTDITFTAEPFIPVRKENRYFLKNNISASVYFSLMPPDETVILALQCAGGTISGIDTNQIPPNEKFYLGGGGTIRGYGDKLVGKLDNNNRPIGGKSYIQTNIEARIRLKNDFGFVIFLDSGNIFDSTMPKINDKFFYGVGFGIRYFTDFGPLRFDIGFPTSKRDKIDKSYQLYFGIGQDF